MGASNQDCVFCQIRDGLIPASFVLDCPEVYALMSLDQPNPYKVLVVPKRHVTSIYDLDESLAASVFWATVRLARAVRTTSHCDGLNIVQSNGEAGQQDIFHFHIHILPRFVGDGIRLDWDTTEVARADLDRMAERIRAVLRS